VHGYRHAECVFTEFATECCVLVRKVIESSAKILLENRFLYVFPLSGRNSLSIYICLPFTKFKTMPYKHISILLISLCFMKQSESQGFLRAEGERIVNEKGENVLLRGIGLGGWMLQEGYMLHVNKESQQYRMRQRIEDLVGMAEAAEFYDAWLSYNTTRSDMDSLHAWGFNSVRLPMHYNLFTLPVDKEPVAGQNTWLQKGFALTDSLIGWCKANGMYVILDLHASPGGQGNDLNISDRDPSKPSLWQSEANRKKTIALWRKLAERYAGESTVAGYDLLNEPNWGFEDTLKDRNGLSEQKNIPLKQLLVDITTSIREVDKKHIIIIEGNGWGNNYRGMLGPWDNNMVLSFHKYWNKNDQQSIQHILNYRNEYHVPVWLGETGENSNTWFTEAIHLFETNNIGWSWWPLKKLGNNNPLQIPSNPDYDSLTDYWNGKSNKAPNAENAYHGLMELALHSKTENNIVHNDVVDAMIRQPFSHTAIPFRSNIISAKTMLEVTDYDLGANGVAYFDRDTANYRLSTGKESTGNLGRVYRNDGVDIYPVAGAAGHFYVGHIENDEWLQYTIQIPEGGKYKLAITGSADGNDGVISFYDDGNPIGQKIPVPSTGGKENWKTIAVINVPLSKGIHHLRLYAVKGGFNLSSVLFSKM
jgi:endoglucanase